MLSPSQVFRALGDVLANPKAVSTIAWIYILAYYAVSFAFVWGARHQKVKGLLKRDGVVDKITSAFWIIFAVILIWSLLALSAECHLTLGVLAEFYLFFLFLFAFLYGLIEWHWPGKVANVGSTHYEAELQYLLISIGAQTTRGFTRARPNHWVTEVIAAVQSLLGIAFIAIFIALAVNKISS